jgi:hypothetical protein
LEIHALFCHLLPLPLHDFQNPTPHAPRRALPTDSIQQREKEAGQLTMQAVRIAIFFVNYLIENRRAVLPSSATALLYEEQTPRPTPCPPAASIQNPPKEAGQFTVQVVSFVIFFIWSIIQFELSR